MRVLCLHGCDQKATEFEKDLEAVFAEAQRHVPDLTSVYIDGSIESVNQRSTFTLYNVQSSSELQKAREWLGRHLEQHGPFDGVIACSQGAAVVSSYMVHEQWHHPDQDAPFQFAFFIGGSIPLQTLKDLGVTVKAAEQIVSESEVRREGGSGPSPSHVAGARRALFNSDDCFGLDLNAIPRELKIRIPTVHVWGDGDPCFPGSVQLAGLCDPYIRRVHIHARAHGVPTGLDEVGELAQLLLWCMRRAQWPGRSQLHGL